MRGFDAIRGQDLPVKILRHYMRSGRVPHALLFTGIEGIGKRTTARLFAMALNCTRSPAGGGTPETAAGDAPCGQCRVCRRIVAGKHPDVIELAPIKGILRIEQIRHLLAGLAMKPFSAPQRVVLIGDAQAMNAAAANALLKMLEEPPEATTLILTAHQRADLLPTIASRCRHLRFSPLASADIVVLLRSALDISDEAAGAVAESAEGSYTRALRLAQAGWLARRDWLLRATGLDQPPTSTPRPLTWALALSAQLAGQKDRIETDFEILKSWIRDLSVWPYLPARIIHRDREATLAHVGATLGAGQLLDLWEVLEKAEKNIAANGNLRLTLDVMTLRMAQVVKGR
ncbi:MAG: DNA polymerase III subunit delta' [Desulfatitalea sp.]|nr:DNA polymerase III subunit delta' [Desulfatitalea sp.]NNJ99186.1 DNA polymerase III subunit delta' [Desulfatitalea sp.]